MGIDKKLCKDTVNMLAQSDERLEIMKTARVVYDVFGGQLYALVWQPLGSG